MKVLLHTCCAACTIAASRALADEGHEVTGFFYNANIHPLVEFRRRLKAMKMLQERLPLPVIYVEDYGLAEWLRCVDWRGDRRCEECYRQRLSRAAAEARARGFPAISTTLLASTHQNQDLLRRVGAECAKAEAVEFVYRDWRPLAEEAHKEASRLRLYLQQYCGCVFSEYERFKDTTQHLYRGSGPLKDAGN